MEEKKIRDEELNLANGGCGTVNMIIGDPQCNCRVSPWILLQHFAKFV